MGSSALYDKAKASAEKILGTDGKVPDLPSTLEKAYEARKKADEAFKKAQETLEASLIEVQNANDAVRNQMKQFAAKLGKEDFNLDTKDKENLKKIQQAQKILDDLIDSAIKAYSEDDKMLDELDKHVIQLGKYKPGTHRI